MEVYSTIYDTPKLMFAVQLAELEHNEYCLDDGRFAKYAHFKEEHTFVTGVPEYQVTEWFVDRLEWIATNVKSRWSFDLEMASVHSGKMTWSFQDLKEALLFRLSF